MTGYVRKNQGQSTIEFVSLIMFLLVAFLVFQKYIVRGFSGRWKGVGESLGQGRIYDPNRTVKCGTNRFFIGQEMKWYNQECFEEECEPACLGTGKNLLECDNCLMKTCYSEFCDE